MPAALHFLDEAMDVGVEAGKFLIEAPRELEVLKHVVQGRLNKQIAYDLGIHERTVKLHRTAITTKLGVHSTAELTKLWIEVGGLEAIEEERKI